MDLTAKQLNWTQRAMSAAVELDELVTELAELTSEYPFVGNISQGTLDASSLKHIDAADLNILVARYTDIAAWLNAQNRRDVLRKLRP